jgi:hypothetical protein
VLKFSRLNHKFYDANGMEAYWSRRGRWQFVIIGQREVWTSSYRLSEPNGRNVSASSTMEGPFNSFEDALNSAENMLAKLNRMS